VDGKSQSVVTSADGLALLPVRPGAKVQACSFTPAFHDGLASDGRYYKRTGDASVRDEADFQLSLAELGYPVPRIACRGVEDGQYYFVEPSAGVSLQDQALAEAGDQEQVSDSLISAAVDIAVRLFEAPGAQPDPCFPGRAGALFPSSVASRVAAEPDEA
jgi:hypothetical protein